MSRLRWAALLAVALMATFIGFERSAEEARAAGPGSCIGAGACQFATATIGANSCNGVNACQSAGGTIGDNSCNGLEACLDALLSGGSIGNDSCNGVDACKESVAAGGSIGDDSCIGGGACEEALESSGGSIGNGSCRDGTSPCGDFIHAVIGDGACIGNNACDEVGGGSDTPVPVGDGSCIGDTACRQLGASDGAASVGAGSCLGPNACRLAGAQVASFAAGDGSCLGENACVEAGRFGSAGVGDGSCIGTNACVEAGEGDSFQAGDYSCNGPNQCQFLAPATVGDCDENSVFVPECKAPRVMHDLFDQATGAAYVPGTWTRGPVLVRFNCLPALDDGAPIAPRPVHGSTPGGNTYPAEVKVQKTTDFRPDPDWRCVDVDGVAAPVPAAFPVPIRIDRVAPRCAVALSLTRISKAGTPTPVTATVGATDSGGSGVDPAALAIVSISPAPEAGGPALADVSPGTWTLRGAIGKTFVFTGRATDRAGNVSAPCTARVASSLK